MNVSEFVAKWGKSELRERQGSQSHFNDLCRVLGVEEPAKADPIGDTFCFERGAAKHGGGDGWADVWKKGFFGWEYKGKHKNLEAAYDQLLLYRSELENPALLIVSDMDRIIIRTNYTNTAEAKYEIRLADLHEPRSMEILRAVFQTPENLKPGAGSRVITEKAAALIAQIAQSLRDRGAPAPDVAHFLDRIVFCLFAEDVGLLPERLFTRLLGNTKDKPGVFVKSVATLFDSMAHGGLFGSDTIRHFNGNLFDSTTVLELDAAEIETIYKAALLEWDAVDPSIFGTLFERGLDPDKRAQLGAHYTSREDIETLVEPVVMTPLRRDWARVVEHVQSLLATGKKALGDAAPPAEGQRKLTPQALKKAHAEAERLIHGFLVRLAAVKVLDPACGSGNFLYVTLQKLKDLERDAILYANRTLGVSYLPMVGPWQMYGIEINPYAHDLAQMTVWIGYLQWTRANGFGVTQDPILRPLDNFKCMDAILDLSDPDNPKEPEWPAVDFIVGNPPFLGGNKIRQELGNAVDSLFAVYASRVPAFSDLCCYWFDKARRQIENGACRRAGLLATQGIRGGVNRDVLQKIKMTGGIFFAESDRDWILDGANVHVSMVGFDGGMESESFLDGQPVGAINSNLTWSADTTTAKRLKQNKDLCVYGSQQKGSFDIPFELALTFLHSPNPSGKPNSDVVRPALNAAQMAQRTEQPWVIDFGVDMTMEFASRFQEPFEYVKKVVFAERAGRKEIRQVNFWWLHARPSPRYRAILEKHEDYVASPAVSKHRLFVWIPDFVLVDHACLVYANTSVSFFGVLHSRLHEVWALRLGTRLETRPRYTPTTCFETFPLPYPTAAQEAAIGAAAKELDDMRRGWLNPVEWTREEVLEFPGSVDGPWARFVHEPDARGIGTVRWPRLVARDESLAKELAKRTLTNLYNQRPAWLDFAHKKLDAAVCAAYGWPVDLTDEQILEKLLALNLERAEK